MENANHETAPLNEAPTAAPSAPPLRPVPPAPPHVRERARSEKTTPAVAPGALGVSPFWPVLLVTLAVLSWAGFQTWQLVGEQQTLRAAQEQQEPLVQNSGKMRQQLDALAAQTQRLAEQGNPNAKLLVDDLKRRGVTINPSAPAK